MPSIIRSNAADAVSAAGAAACLAGVCWGLDLTAGGFVGVGFCVVVAAVRGREFVVVDEFVFWEKAIVDNDKRSAKLKENLLMMCSS
jgi:hypothetical protein